MLEHKKLFLLTELILGIVLIVVLSFMLFKDNANQIRRIYVIVPDSDNNDKTSFKYGLKTAAKEFDMDLVVVSTGEFSEISEVESVVNRELKNNVDAMIIEPVYGEDQGEILKEIQNNIPIIIINSKVDKENNGNFAVVAPDNYDIGKQLGEEIKGDFKEGITNRRINIFVRNKNDEKYESRIKGICSVLENNCASLNVVEKANVELMSLLGIRGGDIMVALDDKSLLSAVEYKRVTEEEDVLVYGVANSSEAVYHVDDGSVESIIVPDDYSMGYQSVKLLDDYFRSIFRKRNVESIETSYLVLRQENLFDDENQTLLFTLSH